MFRSLIATHGGKNEGREQEQMAGSGAGHALESIGALVTTARGPRPEPPASTFSCREVWGVSTDGEGPATAFCRRRRSRWVTPTPTLAARRPTRARPTTLSTLEPSDGSVLRGRMGGFGMSQPPSPRRDKDAEAGGGVGDAVHALGRGPVVARLGAVDVAECLAIAVDVGEPTALHLHHDGVFASRKAGARE